MKIRIDPRMSLRLKTKLAQVIIFSLVIVMMITVGLVVYFNFGITPPIHAAPPTNISGVINSYLRVTSVNLGTRTFVANNLSGSASDFQAGKTAMILQVKGASISTSNNSSYGTITSFNDAGNYEFAVMSSVSSSGGVYTVTFSSLVNNYTTGEVIQLVSVPEYTDANISGTVTAIPWNASQGRGGVVAFQVSNELTLSADIDVSGQGFTGGQKEGSDGSCPDDATYRSNSNAYAAKGESISTNGRLYARGAQATAGGGGNPHNAGGGGGSNFTYGGEGGAGWQPGGGCTNASAGGLPGKSIAYSTLTKVFFGGGGGAGQQNDGNASNGASGGGIIIVRAKSVKSSCGGTYGFRANGNSAANSSGNDGAGGGGGGGVIVLDVLTYNLSCPVTVQANGGNGGSVNNSAAHGGGGGGGIGVIMETTPTSNSNVTILSTPGNNGADCTTCTTPSGALPQTPASYKIGISNIPGSVATLPVKFLSVTGKLAEEGVQLNWSTASEENNDYFTAEHSSDGINFVPFAEVPGAGNSTDILHYSVIDKEFYPTLTYYRVKQTDYDGKFAYSKLIQVKTQSAVNDVSLYPNPASNFVTITKTGDGPLVVRFVDEKGQEVLRETINDPSHEVDVSSLNPGIYVVEMVENDNRKIIRLVIKR